MLDKFIEQNTGKVISFDNVPANAGQSVQLIAAWCQFLGLPYQWANAADWWDDGDDTFGLYWEKVENDPRDGTQLPLPGDIMVFADSLPGSDGHGHLSIFVRHKGDNSWEGFDANWGGKSAHLQSHNWSYVLGWYTPLNKSVLEEPTPTPIAQEAPYAPYEATPMESTIVTIKRDNALLYSLSDVSWESFNQNPLGAVAKGTEIVVTAVARHRLGGTYYMPDVNRAEGYRVADCEEFVSADDNMDNIVDTPPLKKAGAPGPLASPALDDLLHVPFKVPRYRRFTDAFERQNPDGEWMPGKYYVYKHLKGMLHLTLAPGVPTGFWVNPEDMKVEPTPVMPPPAVAPPKEDWRDTFDLLIGGPRYFAAVHNGPVVDLSGERPNLYIVSRQPILIAGVFRGPDGVVYGAPDMTANHKDGRLWYGVPRDNLRPISKPAQVITEEMPESAHTPVPAYVAVDNGYSSGPYPIAPSLSLYARIKLLLKELKQKYTE